MNVLMISPGFPADMPYFTRALAQIGARVLGVGDQSISNLAPEVAEVLSGYLQPSELWDEDRTVDDVSRWLRARSSGSSVCGSPASSWLQSCALASEFPACPSTMRSPSPTRRR